MSFKNKTKIVLLAVVAITSLLIGNAFQAYATQDQSQKVPTLVVFVNVINDDGGTMNPSDFVLAATAKDPSPAIFSGSQTGTTVTMKNGVYNVTELAVKGYNISYSPGCSGRINNNEAKTCVVTNDDIAPHLKVIKHVINDDGGTADASNFSISVCCNNPSPSYFQGSENGTDVKIGPGFYNVYENYWGQDYMQSYSSDCNGQINLGENKTCTITNDDRPKAHLIVIKHVINDNGGTASASDFTMSVCCNSPLPSSFSGSENGTNVTMYEGWYSVGENWNPDYIQSSSINCSGYILAGETRTCTITNDDRPKAYLIVNKHVINDNGGTASASDFTLYVSGNSPLPGSFSGSEHGTNVTLYEGWYSVGEYWNPNYIQSSSSDCSGYIYAGETKTCTITNDDKPKANLIVIKHVINDNGGTANASDFTIFVSGDSPSPSNFSGSENGTNVTMNEGWYSVWENGNPNYNQTSSIDCSGNISAGETKTCTITNDDVP